MLRQRGPRSQLDAPKDARTLPFKSRKNTADAIASDAVDDGAEGRGALLCVGFSSCGWGKDSSLSAKKKKLQDEDD